MGKTRDLVKTIKDTKGIFHAKMDKIKDRNAMDLTEPEDIKKRWQNEACRRILRLILSALILQKPFLSRWLLGLLPWSVPKGPR